MNITLLEHGHSTPSKNLADSNGDAQQTVLMKRIQDDGGDEIVSSMVPNHLESLEATDYWGNTALHYAAVWGYSMTARRLLSHGANPRARTVSGAEYKLGTQGPTALQLAAMHGQEDVLHTLLHYDIVPEDELKDTLFASSKHGRIVPALIQEHVFESEVLAVALAIAVRNGREAAATTLIGKGEILQKPVDIELAVEIYEADVGADEEARLERERILNTRNSRTALTEGEEAEITEDDPSLSAEAGDFVWQAGMTVGSMMITLALRNEIDAVTSLLIRMGAGPSFCDFAPKELHYETSSHKHPFSLALKHEAFGSAISMLPAGFLTQPGTSLYAGLCVSEAAQKLAQQLRVIDPPRAAKLRRQAKEAEMMTLSLLQTLPETRQVDLLRSAEGEDFIRLAARLNSSIVLSQPIVQEDMKYRWLGGVIDGLLRGRGVNAWGDRVRLSLAVRARLALLLLFLLPLNLLCIPVLAFAPSLETSIIALLNQLGEMGERDGKLMAAGFSRRFMLWTSDFWLLGVPLIKSSLLKVSNCTLAFLVVFDAAPTWLYVAWAGSILATESFAMYQGKPYIHWASWMLILASGMMIIGSVMDYFNCVECDAYVPYETGRGFLALGTLLILLHAIGLLFLQSSFLGPMVTTISQMIEDALAWGATLLAGVLIFTVGFQTNLRGDLGEDGEGVYDSSGIWIPAPNATEGLGETALYLLNLGLKVSPLMGAKPLIKQDEQDSFEYVMLLSYFMIQSTMLYSMLVALFSTRLTKDEASRIPKYHLSFCKLVLNEHLRSTAPMPLVPCHLFEYVPRTLARCVPQRRSPQGSRRSSLTVRSSTRPMFKHDSTPEKTWHTSEYTRENPPIVLLKKTSEHVMKEMMKLEGPMKALTGDSKFREVIRDLSEVKTEVLGTYKEGVDAIFRRVTGLGKEMNRDMVSLIGRSSETKSAGSALVDVNSDGNEKPRDLKTAVRYIEKRLLERFAHKWRRGDGGKRAHAGVTVYKGFTETADRLVFPYGMYANANVLGGKFATHMTILSNGKIENPAKRLWLSGKFSEGDRSALMNEPHEELMDMLKKRLTGARKQEYDQIKNDPAYKSKAKCVDRLMNENRETDLEMRALCAFPFMQGMSKKDANAHLAPPNNVFVRKRDNGEWGVSHCWPVKYNEQFKKDFVEFIPFFESKSNERQVGQVDPSRFSPRAAVEFRDCMQKLFGRLSSDCKVIFASKQTQNEHLAVVGVTEDIVQYLRHNPSLQKVLGIAKMQPDGFTARVVVKGKFKSFKQFGMAFDGTPQVAYVKKGFETMASVKPYDLFLKDCKFGPRLADTELKKVVRKTLKPIMVAEASSANVTASPDEKLNA